MGEVIGIINRDGDQKFFVVANKVSSDWEKQLTYNPGFRALHCM